MQILGLILASIGLAFATTTDIPKKIGTANKAVQVMRGPQPECASCTGMRKDADPSQLARECAAAVCPKGYGHFSRELWARVSNYLIDDKNAAAISHPSSAVRAAIESQLSADQFLLEELDKKEPLTEPKALFMQTFMRGLQNSSQMQMDEKGEIQFISAKTDGEAPSQDQLLGKRTLAIMVKALNEQPAFLTDNFEKMELTLKPQELKAQALEAFNKLEVLESKAAAELGVPRELFFLNSAQLSDLKAEIESGQISAVTQSRLQGAYVFPSYLAAALHDTEFMSRIDGQGIVGGQAALGFAQALRERISAEKAILEGRDPGNSLYSSYIRDVTWTCMSGFAASMSLAPTEEQRNAFYQSEKKLRAQYIHDASAKLSAHSAGALAKAAQNWKLTPVKTKTEHLESLKSAFKAFVSAAQSNVQLSKIPPRARQVALAALGSEWNTSKPDEAAELIRLKDLCEKFTPLSESDHANLSANSIRFNSYSVTSEAGRRIAANHEYTHLKSGWMKTSKDVSDETRAWYEEKRKCLDRQHRGEKTFDEEDYAEVFARFIAPDADSYICRGDIDSPRVMSLKMNAWDVEHSSAMFNLLMGHLARGEPIPTACKEAIEANGETVNLENCFPPGDTAH